MEWDWIEAIKMVLAAEGRPMRCKDILTKIIENGYRTNLGDTPYNSVNMFLNQNKALFEKVGRGVYTLVGTSVTTPHPRATGTTVGRATPIVVRPSTVYDPYKKHAPNFITSTDSAILSEEVKKQGGDMVFVVAPNKMEVYGEYMPYYLKESLKDGNYEKLMKAAYESL